ncbi:MAG: hypothetical protein HY098_05295 [Nitrospinae bacterium]|nr:hypothetical protein [Nitrospinota bacterium]
MTQSVPINKPVQASGTTKATMVTSYVTRDQICATCHPFSKYTSLLTDVDHVKVGAGSHCNGCHFSAPGVAGSAITGWRWSSASSVTRISSTLWHKDVQGVCTNCHLPANAPKYPANHYTGGCETCHTYNNGSWGSGKGHPAATSGCSACHPAQTHGPITGFSVIAGSQFAGVDCSTCHQPSITASYANWLGAPGTGFHANITGPCLNCHAPSAIPTYPSGHYAAECQKCHTYNGGSWKGATGHIAATTGCLTCHSAHPHTLAGTSVTPGTVFAGADCSICHQPSVAASYTNWLGAPGVGFHAGLTGACTNCHTASAIPTYPTGHHTAGCESCHTYNGGSWKGATGHPSVASGCPTCHTPHTHLAIAGTSVTTGAQFTGVDCATCHQPSVAASYANWLGAPGAGFHAGLTGPCTNCHTPSAIPTYPAGHNTAGCEKCHTYNNGSWKGHQAVTAGCATCHAIHTHNPMTGYSVTNGAQFAGVDCSTCHQPSVAASYTNWLGAPGAGFHSGITAPCLDCHTPSAIPTYPSGHYASGCEACHTYNGGSWLGAAGHANVTTGCNRSGCHATHTHTTVSSATLLSPETFSGISCENCHSASITSGYANWLGAAHEASPAACNTCHATHTHTTLASGTIANGSTFSQFSGTGCEKCHAASAPGYASWLGAGSGALHMTTPPACNTCHQKHNNTKNCINCHTNTFYQWTGAGG